MRAAHPPPHDEQRQLCTVDPSPQKAIATLFSSHRIPASVSDLKIYCASYELEDLHYELEDLLRVFARVAALALPRDDRLHRSRTSPRIDTADTDPGLDTRFRSRALACRPADMSVLNERWHVPADAPAGRASLQSYRIAHREPAHRACKPRSTCESHTNNCVSRRQTSPATASSRCRQTTVLRQLQIRRLPPPAEGWGADVRTPAPSH